MVKSWTAQKANEANTSECLVVQSSVPLSTCCSLRVAASLLALPVS